MGERKKRKPDGKKMIGEKRERFGKAQLGNGSP